MVAAGAIEVASARRDALKEAYSRFRIFQAERARFNAAAEESAKHSWRKRLFGTSFVRVTIGRNRLQLEYI